MTRKEVLKKYIELEAHNLFCYSANYGMTKARPGYEADFSEARERLTILEAMAEEETAPALEQQERQHEVDVERVATELLHLQHEANCDSPPSADQQP